MLKHAIPSLILFSACQPSDVDSVEPVSDAPVMLVWPDDWQQVAEAVDPFVEYRPDGALCLQDGWGASDFGGELAFDVDTWLCDYITVQAPIREAIEVGDLVTVRLWHFDLLAGEEDAEAWLILSFDEVTLWETHIPIPSDSTLIYDQFEATEAMTQGEVLYFHLQNHGSNSYHLLEVSVL